MSESSSAIGDQSRGPTCRCAMTQQQFVNFFNLGKRSHQTSIPSTGTYKPPTCVSIPPTPQRPATPFSGLMSPNTRTFETDLPHGASVQAMGDAPPRVEVNQSRLQSRDYTTRSDHGGSTVPQTLRGVNPPSSEQNTNLVEPEVPDFLDFTNVHEAFDDFLSLHSNFGGSPVVTKKGDSRKPPPSVQSLTRYDGDSVPSHYQAERRPQGANGKEARRTDGASTKANWPAQTLAQQGEEKRLKMRGTMPAEYGSEATAKARDDLRWKEEMQAAKKAGTSKESTNVPESTPTMIWSSQTPDGHDYRIKPGNPAVEFTIHSRYPKYSR